MLGDCAAMGQPPECTRDFPAKIQAVTALQVRDAARRYLASAALRIVFVGDPEYLVNADALGFGRPIRTNGYGEVFP